MAHTKEGEKMGFPERLLFVHDVCRPRGRRDQYCAPRTIPPYHLHPNSSTLAAKPGEKQLGEQIGFCGSQSDYGYFAAISEGSARNGVMTAVEDYLQHTGETYELIVVPAVFGLGILYPPRRLRSGSPALSATPGQQIWLPGNNI